MATRFNNHMVAHVWAQQSQPRGQSHNGNLYFEGDTLYSYGGHYPLARFVENDAGQRAVLINSNPYSVTTSAHRSRAWRAVCGLGLPIFQVPGCTDFHPFNLRALEREAVEAFERAGRMRPHNRDYGFELANKALGIARDYAEFFGVPFDWEGADQLRARWAAEAAEAEERAREAREEREQRYREQVAKDRAVQREQFEEWQRGERDNAPWAYQVDEDGSAYLRVNGDKLETSRGAEVPLEHAKRAFRLIKRCRDRGESWRPNGHSIHVGHFTVSEITADGSIRAGCHYITWPHIEAAAIAAGVFEAPEPAGEEVSALA